MKIRPISLLLVLGIALALLTAVWIQADRKGEQKLIALLHGDQSISIIRFETLSGLSLFCTDNEVLGYLKSALSMSLREMPNGGGLRYLGRFTFSDKSSFQGELTVRTNGFSISVPSMTPEPGNPTHEVLLKAPLPDKVRLVFEFLNDSDAKTRGNILILEDGKAPERLLVP